MCAANISKKIITEKKKKKKKKLYGTKERISKEETHDGNPEMTSCEVVP